MRKPIITVISLLATTSLLGGCGGPTKAGLEARENANNRIDAVHASLLFDQAEQSLESGQIEKAEDLIRRSLARYPDVAEYQVLAGRIALEQHHLEPAMDSFNKAMEIDPESATAHYYAGIVFERWSDDEQAVQHFMRAHEIDSTSPHYLLAAAEAMVALGEFDDAAALVEGRIKYFEHNTALRQLQGQIAMLQGQPDQAVRFFSEARLLNPDDLLLMEELAWAQFGADDFNECYSTLNTLRPKLPRERPDLMRLEAQCLSMMQRMSDARQLYQQLVRIEPANPDLWIELGTIGWQMGDFPRVAQSGVRAIALAPNRFEGYMLKALNERHHGNMRDAVQFMSQACERCTTTPLPHLLLGSMLEQVGQSQQAGEAYRTALEIDPGSQQAKTLLSRLSKDGGQPTAVTAVDPNASPE